MANLKTEMENIISQLEMSLKESQEKTEFSEKRVNELDTDLKASLGEVSELRSELIEGREDFLRQKAEYTAQGEENVMSISAKASKFELMYNDELVQMQAVKDGFEKKIKEMNRNQELLKEVNFGIKTPSLLTFL